MIHKLKIQTEYLNNLINGSKKSEIRNNDRDYQKGDILQFTGDNKVKYLFEISHIHSGLGLLDGYVVLSVKVI